MAEVQPVNAPVANDQPAAQPGNTTWTVVKGFLFRMVVIYVISSLFRTWRGEPIKPDRVNLTETGGKLRESGGEFHSRPPGAPSQNLYHKGFAFDLYVYLWESEQFDAFSDPKALFWHESNLVYGDWTSGDNSDGSRTFSGHFETSETLQQNGSIYAHIYVVPIGKSPDPADKDNYSKRMSIHQSKRLNRFRRKKYQKTANLLTGNTELTDEHLQKAETIKSEVLSHWHPNLTINLVDDHTGWTRGSLPPPLDEAVHFDALSGDYYPIVYVNDYWNLAVDYQPINETVKVLNLSLTYSPISLFKWQMYASQGMRNKWTAMLGGEMFEENDEDQDSLKQAILETNPYLLGMTIVVSLLHTVFEFLAFKNDIQFWRNKKSLEGLSVRSVLFNLFQSVIVLLYVLDNDTNFVVRMSIGVGLLIELWKIPKVMDIKIDRERKWFGLVPRVTFSDKGSYVESSTRHYDQLAFKYLSWALFPLLGGYAVYSLIYHEHRGWYSFVLSMMYGFLLTFGFIMMTPQLFINYKLKSVAHLPWRMLCYKTLSTFIDDIFAFVIKMPTMYRIGCFRDDIVFLIYVYQRWIYRVDKTRVNEFGYVGEEQPAEANGDAIADHPHAE